MAENRYPFEGTEPSLHGTAAVSRASTLVGDVTVEANASVWPGAVLRGDTAPVSIGRETHVTENVSIHASTVGERGMIGLGSVVNQSELGHDTLVGMNATVNEATIGDHCIIATGAVLQQGRTVPPESFVYDVPAKVSDLADTDLDVEGLYDRYADGTYTDVASRYGDLFE